ncbi:hypothetical protein [uncultured Cellulomonas sp.]|nr:hypothetical protein [uncultured Cellulomonas sp.]
MYRLPVRSSLWSRRSADRIDRLVAARRSSPAATLPLHLGLR